MANNELWDYAIEVFRLKLGAGGMPTFGECLAQALCAYEIIDAVELERYKHERARQCDCEVDQCQNNPS